MLRLTEIKLPLTHSEDDLKAAILKRLDFSADDLIGHTIFRRGFDARKPSSILFIYTLDVEVKNEAALFKRLHGTPHITISPDMSYHFVAQAPQGLTERPIVIGTGPCGIFAGLILA